MRHCDLRSSAFLKWTLAAFVLLFLRSSSAFAQDVPTDDPLADVKTKCDLFYEVYRDAEDTCYYRIAVTERRAEVCGLIFWQVRRKACYGRVESLERFSLSLLLSYAPFVILFALLFYDTFRTPPRTHYLWGGLIGAFLAITMDFLGTRPETPWSSLILSLLHIPIDGPHLFAPPLLSSYSPFQQLLLVHIVVYGLILGLLMHGVPESRRKAFIILGAITILTIFQGPISTMLTKIPSMYQLFTI